MKEHGDKVQIPNKPSAASALNVFTRATTVLAAQTGCGRRVGKVFVKRRNEDCLLRPSPRPPGGWRMAMDLYLSNCYNTAQAAAAKAAASSLTADREQCNSVSGDQLVLLRDPGLVSEGKEGGQTEEGEISAEAETGLWRLASGSQAPGS